MKNKPITIEKLPLIVATLKNSFPDAPVVRQVGLDQWELIAKVWNSALINDVDPEKYFRSNVHEIKGAEDLDLDETLLFFAHMIAQIEQDCYTGEKLN
mgnify:CR=1 FL=1|tara:strand:+ start:463 stop:756 length:294 start_codon:yes stop_codon:yes gene_type:complete